MAITAKPVAYTVDTAHAKCPDHLYLFDEGDGVTVADQGSATPLNVTITNDAMWGLDATLGNYLECNSTNGYYGISATGTVWNIAQSVMFVVIARSANAVAPATAEYMAGYSNSTGSPVAYGGARVNGTATVLQGVAYDTTNTPANADTTTVYDTNWHMCAVKIKPNTAAEVIGVSVDGETWDTSPTGTLTSTGYSINRYGIGCRPAPSPSNVWNGDILAVLIYENDYASWDDAFIASLYSDPWQFMQTTPEIGTVSTLTDGAAFTITGTKFGGSTGTLTIGGITHATSTWSDTEITGTLSLGNRKYGSQAVTVTNATGNVSAEVTASINPSASYEYVELIVPYPAANRPETTATDVVAGDQFRIFNPVNTTLANVAIDSGGGIELNPTNDALAASIDVQCNDGTGWGTTGTITFDVQAISSGNPGVRNMRRNRIARRLLNFGRG